MHEEIQKFCPNCPPTWIVRNKKLTVRTGAILETVVDNYSGCGIDICVCTKCNSEFQVSYTIDDITPIKR